MAGAGGSWVKWGSNPSRLDRHLSREAHQPAASIPTNRNSAMASNAARTVKMSERALISLRDHASSKLKVPGSNPGGVANEIKRLISIGRPKKLQIGGAGRIATFVVE